MKNQAFLSYAHVDDHFLNGDISWLRNQLESAMHVVSGRPFTIFQDKDGIKLGQHWPKEIDEALRDAKILIPILTPSYFESRYCRTEVEEFLRYEKAINRNDLILPLYLFDVAVLEDDSLRKEDKLAQNLQKRQFDDWRSIADDIQNSEGIRRRVIQLAQQIDLRARHIEPPNNAPSSGALAEATMTNSLLNHKNQPPDQSTIVIAGAEFDDQIIDLEKITTDYKTALNISRHHSAIGGNNAETTRGFWNYFNKAYNNSKDSGYDDTKFIWVLDFGSRIVEDDNAFKEYSNIGTLAYNIYSWSMFDSLNDYGDASDVSSLSVRATLSEYSVRKKRWHWLARRAVVVVQNLRADEFVGIYPQDDENLRSINIRNIGVTAEHVQPSTMPAIWGNQLRELHGKDLDLSDTTLTAWIRRKPLNNEEMGAQDLRYMAHASLPDGLVDRYGMTSASIELLSPGRRYDEAIRIIDLAARYRLEDCNEEKKADCLAATVYLQKLGFQVLQLPDFLRLFTKSL